MNYIYIKDAKDKLQEEFVEKYNHPFIISFVETLASEPQKMVSYSETASKSLNELVKSESQAQNNEVLDIIPIIKTNKSTNTEKIIIGRTNEQDIFIDNLLVSKVHAYIQIIHHNKFVIIDNNSTNGTLLNGVKLEPNIPSLIKDQDKISFGGVKYTFFSSRSAYMFLKRQK